MVATCEEAGVSLSGPCGAFLRNMRRPKRLWTAGRWARRAYTHRAPAASLAGRRVSCPYYSDFTQSGGVILDVGIHDIDYARWCFGEVEARLCRWTTFKEAPRNDPLIVLRFERRDQGISVQLGATGGTFRAAWRLATVASWSGIRWIRLR